MCFGWGPSKSDKFCGWNSEKKKENGTLVVETTFWKKKVYGGCELVYGAPLVFFHVRDEKKTKRLEQPSGKGIDATGETNSLLTLIMQIT